MFMRKWPINKWPINKWPINKWITVSFLGLCLVSTAIQANANRHSQKDQCVAVTGR